MKSYLLISALLFLGLNASAQHVFIPDQNGKQLTDAKYENVTGTPYLIDKWVNGEVKLSDGKTVKPSALKFDLVTDKLLFQENGKTYEFSPKVAAFSLHTDNGTKTFLLKDQNSKEEGYYELLTNGKIQFLKKTKKIVLERKGYNSATVEKTVDENTKYYVVSNGKEVEVKLNKKSLSEALPAFKEKINAFEITQTKKELENGYIAMVNNLNQL